jgi:hypothetical protein
VRWSAAVLFVVVTTGAWCCLVQAISPEEVAPLRFHHPWGRCGEGSWQTVRTVTENLDDRGQITNVSTTETRTTLEQATADGVTLRVEVILEVGGKRLMTQPQIVRQAFSGAVTGENVTLKKLSPTSVVIDGKQLACESEELEILSQGKKKVSLICFADKNPHVLKRNVVATETSNPAGNSESTAEVIELDMPYKVLSETKKAAMVRIVKKDASGSLVTLTVNVPEVPGEVVAHTSKKVDPKGQVTRRSTLELVGYRLVPLDPSSADKDKDRIPRRRRDRRRAYSQ